MFMMTDFLPVHHIFEKAVTPNSFSHGDGKDETTRTRSSQVMSGIRILLQPRTDTAKVQVE